MTILKPILFVSFLNVIFVFSPTAPQAIKSCPKDGFVTVYRFNFIKRGCQLGIIIISFIKTVSKRSILF